MNVNSSSTSNHADIIDSNDNDNSSNTSFIKVHEDLSQFFETDDDFRNNNPRTIVNNTCAKNVPFGLSCATTTNAIVLK